MAVALAVFAEPVIVLFAGTDPEMTRVGALCLRLQCLTLPIHAWVAVVNMLCIGLGNATGAFLLATARQGSCFIPFIHLFAFLWQENGVAAIQAAADVLSMLLAVPLAIVMMKKIKAAIAEQRSQNTIPQ